MIDNYYIYIYLDPRKSGQYCYKDFCFLSEPMYIGKDKNKRYLDKLGRNRYLIRKINKIKQYGLEPIVFKLYENLSENQSFEFEKQSIMKKGIYKGEKNPNSILTEENVIEIWKDLNNKIFSQKEIVKKVGVDQTTISNIKTEKTWYYLYTKYNKGGNNG